MDIHTRRLIYGPSFVNSLKVGKNVLTISEAPCSLEAVLLTCVSFQKYKNTLPRVAVKNDVDDALNDVSSDLIVETIKSSNKCPITMMSMVYPSKGIDCQHYEVTRS